MAEISNPRGFIFLELGYKEFRWLSSLWGLECIKYRQGSIAEAYLLATEIDTINQAHHIRRTRVEF